MTDPFEKHHTDTLILLVGGNPLPNYVAAHLLSHPQSQLVLIHSEGTQDQAKRIKDVLRDEGRTQSELKDVNESDPASIYDAVQAAAKQYSSGSIGLNYTGGTKAMAVHAYRALEQTNPQAIFSYLDARSLSIVIDRTDFLPIAHRVAVSLDTLLALHGLGSHKQAMKRSITPKLSATRAALLEIHTDAAQREEWRSWCQAHLRRENGKYKSDGDLNRLTITDVTVSAVQRGLRHDAPNPNPNQSPLKDILDRKGGGIAKWLEGDWFEENIFTCLQAGIEKRTSCDLAMTINPSFGSTDFEFDVGLMYGHQFFGISVTTDDTKSLCKSKLLEAVVRTEQLGGAEARCALVCCAKDDVVQQLGNEVQGLPNERLIRVFGSHQVGQLADHLDQWIEDASRGV